MRNTSSTPPITSANRLLVTLSAAKGLARRAERCFAALSMTKPALIVNIHYLLRHGSNERDSSSPTARSTPCHLSLRSGGHGVTVQTVKSCSSHGTLH